MNRCRACGSRHRELKDLSHVKFTRIGHCGRSAEADAIYVCAGLRNRAGPGSTRCVPGGGCCSRCSAGITCGMLLLTRPIAGLRWRQNSFPAPVLLLRRGNRTPSRASVTRLSRSWTGCDPSGLTRQRTIRGGFGERAVGSDRAGRRRTAAAAVKLHQPGSTHAAGIM